MSWNLGARHEEHVHDALENSLEYGVDVIGRRLYLHGDIDEESTMWVLRGLDALVTLNPRRIIELHISSEGGDMIEAMAIHDAIRVCPAPVHTYAIGKCMSAAPYILAAGAPGHRYAAASCLFMCHAASVSTGGHPTNAVATAQAIDQFGQMMDRQLADLTNKDYSHWARIARSPKDHYFTSKEALEWGLIDEIWAPEAK